MTVVKSGESVVLEKNIISSSSALEQYNVRIIPRHVTKFTKGNGIVDLAFEMNQHVLKEISSRYCDDDDDMENCKDSLQGQDENEIDIDDDDDDDDKDVNEIDIEDDNITTDSVGSSHMDNNEIKIKNGEKRPNFPPQTNECLHDKKGRNHNLSTSPHVPNETKTETNSLAPNIPHLLILGTGCASPSPLRGSSGYAILLPSIRNSHALTALLDCGEGCLTALSRHLPQTKKRGMDGYLKDLKFVWISHSHFDHYGGLPTLLHAVRCAGGRQTVCTCNETSKHQWKRQRVNHHKCRCNLPLVIIAPVKVLRFLDAALHCKNGVVYSNDHGGGGGVISQRERLYFGITHSDFEYAPFAQYIREIVFEHRILRRVVRPYPKERRVKMDDSDEDNPLEEKEEEEYRPFVYLRSIPVDHCPHAHALILGLDLPYNDDSTTSLLTNSHQLRGGSSLSSFHTLQPSSRPFYICYSGDTRPSLNLIRSCLNLPRNQQISLLIHESTFDDDDKGKKEAIQKRHSTVCEALRVGCDIDAEGCVLTHFSQRYPRVPPGFVVEGGEGQCDGTGGREMEKRKGNHGRNVCMAVDGMMIPLTMSGLSALSFLNKSLLELFQVMQKSIT